MRLKLNLETSKKIGMIEIYAPVDTQASINGPESHNPNASEQLTKNKNFMKQTLI
jgi:hypothetical protein